MLLTLSDILGTIEKNRRTFKDVVGHLGTIEKNCQTFREIVG